jgi:hypothetical protein
MGHFQDDYKSASADLVEYYGQPVSYTDPSLSRQIFLSQVEVFPEKTSRRQNQHGWYVVQARSITFLADDLRAVRIDGTFTIGEHKYSIESIGNVTGERFCCELIRVSAAEVNRPGYRGVV